MVNEFGIIQTRQPKSTISIRVDRDVLEWFRSSYNPYQTKMNAVLREYMEGMKNG